jgi:hypothetical protein
VDVSRPSRRPFLGYLPVNGANISSKTRRFNPIPRKRPAAYLFAKFSPLKCRFIRIAAGDSMTSPRTVTPTPYLSPSPLTPHLSPLTPHPSPLAAATLTYTTYTTTAHNAHKYSLLVWDSYRLSSFSSSLQFKLHLRNSPPALSLSLSLSLSLLALLLQSDRLQRKWKWNYFRHFYIYRDVPSPFIRLINNPPPPPPDSPTTLSRTIPIQMLKLSGVFVHGIVSALFISYWLRQKPFFLFNI